MPRPTRLTMLITAVALAGCGDEPPTTKRALPKIVELAPGSDPLAQASSPPSPPGPQSARGENDGSPDITPAPLTPDAARSETGARTMLLAWARGIELREFDQAWKLMGDAAKAQMSQAQFNALFRPLQDLTVAVPAGEMEGAAGSSFYTVPTTVTGTRADGGEVTMHGKVVLRRVNDVPGATPAQLTWHIVSVDLAPG